jgi:hypothetical protein
LQICIAPEQFIGVSETAKDRTPASGYRPLSFRRFKTRIAELKMQRLVKSLIGYQECSLMRR